MDEYIKLLYLSSQRCAVFPIPDKLFHSTVLPCLPFRWIDGCSALPQPCRTRLAHFSAIAAYVLPTLNFSSGSPPLYCAAAVTGFCSHTCRALRWRATTPPPREHLLQTCHARTCVAPPALPLTYRCCCAAARYLPPAYRLSDNARRYRVTACLCARHLRTHAHAQRQHAPCCDNVTRGVALPATTTHYRRHIP